jgi:hypothetical protein
MLTDLAIEIVENIAAHDEMTSWRTSIDFLHYL